MDHKVRIEKLNSFNLFLEYLTEFMVMYDEKVCLLEIKEKLLINVFLLNVVQIFSLKYDYEISFDKLLKFNEKIGMEKEMKKEDIEVIRKFIIKAKKNYNRV